jgi:hypothetical protein
VSIGKLGFLGLLYVSPVVCSCCGIGKLDYLGILVYLGSLVCLGCSIEKRRYASHGNRIIINMLARLLLGGQLTDRVVSNFKVGTLIACWSIVSVHIICVLTINNGLSIRMRIRECLRIYLQNK